MTFVPSLDARRSAPPLVLDLTRASETALAAGVRAPRRADRMVIDLGERRTLPPDAIEALLATHRALRRARGRCAIVVGPALASQLSLAYPEGLLWAADREAALAALRGRAGAPRSP